MGVNHIAFDYAMIDISLHCRIRCITAWAFLFKFPFLTPEIYSLSKTKNNQTSKQTKTKPKGKDDVYYDYVFFLLADEQSSFSQRPGRMYLGRKYQQRRREGEKAGEETPCSCRGSRM